MRKVKRQASDEKQPFDRDSAGSLSGRLVSRGWLGAVQPGCPQWLGAVPSLDNPLSALALVVILKMDKLCG